MARLVQHLKEIINLVRPDHKLELHSDWQKAATLREEWFMKRNWAKSETLTPRAGSSLNFTPGTLSMSRMKTLKQNPPPFPYLTLTQTVNLLMHPCLSKSQ